MQEICSSNSPVVTGTCNPNKFRARHYNSLKIGSKLKYYSFTFNLRFLYEVKHKVRLFKKYVWDYPFPISSHFY